MTILFFLRRTRFISPPLAQHRLQLPNRWYEFDSYSYIIRDESFFLMLYLVVSLHYREYANGLFKIAITFCNTTFRRPCLAVTGFCNHDNQQVGIWFLQQFISFPDRKGHYRWCLFFSLFLSCCFRFHTNLFDGSLSFIWKVKSDPGQQSGNIS